MELKYSGDRIDDEISVLGALLSQELKGKNVLVCPILLGAMVFAGKLLTRLTFDTKLSYMQMSRYGTAKKADGPISTFLPPFAGQHVLLLDEIYDDGFTLNAAIQLALDSGAESVTSAVLLERVKTRPSSLHRPTFVGIYYSGTEYLVGEGLDSDGKYRNLPGIWALK
jgi:hypoxanthine phosphoribosyltransferase